MNQERWNPNCPDCRSAMRAIEIVNHGDRRSCWWRCTNVSCQAMWLIPQDGGVVVAAGPQASPSLADGHASDSPGA